MLDKDKTYNKWSAILDIDNSQKNWMDQILVNDRGFGEGVQVEKEEIEWKNPDYSQIVFPIVRRVFAQTLAGGGWRQSKKQKQKQDRLNKLRQLKGENPNVILPDDEFFDGLVSVQPISLPTGKLLYMDFKYDTIYKPKKRKKINRVDKFKYILKNNNKKWMISRFLKKKL